MRDQVARSSDKPRERAIFSKIASQIPKLEGQRVAYCFQALCSESPSVQDLVGIVDGLTVEDAKFVASECNWMTVKHWAKWWMRPEHWAKWWMRPEHLQMLHKDFTHKLWLMMCGPDVLLIQMQLREKNKDSKDCIPVSIQHKLV